MALVTWQKTFTEGVTPLKNADISVYLADTTTAARVFDSNSVLHDSVPQIRTDIAGTATMKFEEDYYTDDTRFDII